MSLFTCSVCLEKDARILDLKEQIKDLRALTVSGQTRADPTLSELEANSVLGGSSDIIEIDETAQEADSLLTGSYDTSQVEIY